MTKEKVMQAIGEVLKSCDRNELISKTNLAVKAITDYIVDNKINSNPSFFQKLFSKSNPVNDTESVITLIENLFNTIIGKEKLELLSPKKHQNEVNLVCQLTDARTKSDDAATFLHILYSNFSAVHYNIVNQERKKQVEELREFTINVEKKSQEDLGEQKLKFEQLQQQQEKDQAISDELRKQQQGYKDFIATQNAKLEQINTSFMQASERNSQLQIALKEKTRDLEKLTKSFDELNKKYLAITQGKGEDGEKQSLSEELKLTFLQMQQLSTVDFVAELIRFVCRFSQELKHYHKALFAFLTYDGEEALRQFTNEFKFAKNLDDVKISEPLKSACDSMLRKRLEHIKQNNKKQQFQKLTLTECAKLVDKFPWGAGREYDDCGNEEEKKLFKMRNLAKVILEQAQNLHKSSENVGQFFIPRKQ